MTTQQKKDYLISRIQQVNDPRMISHLSKLIDLEIELKSKEPYQLTELEEQALDEAEEDISQGRLLDEAHARHNIKSWLS